MLANYWKYMRYKISVLKILNSTTQKQSSFIFWCLLPLVSMHIFIQLGSYCIFNFVLFFFYAFLLLQTL